MGHPFKVSFGTLVEEMRKVPKPTYSAEQRIEIPLKISISGINNKGGVRILIHFGLRYY